MPLQRRFLDLFSHVSFCSPGPGPVSQPLLRFFELRCDLAPPLAAEVILRLRRLTLGGELGGPKKIAWARILGRSLPHPPASDAFALAATEAVGRWWIQTGGPWLTTDQPNRGISMFGMSTHQDLRLQVLTRSHMSLLLVCCWCLPLCFVLSV